MSDIGESGSVEEVVVIPLTEEEVKILDELKQLEDSKTRLRFRREHECFAKINRGVLWYETLSVAQKAELQLWYEKWLNVTDTLIVPKNLEWL